jgi:DNA-binding Lrp family transcriptional regulator
MKKKIIALLAENGRMTTAEIAARVGSDEVKVAKTIQLLENNKVIKGYRAIIDDEELYGTTVVRALIEVKITPEREGGFDRIAKRIARFPEVTNLYLVSGRYDLSIEVKGNSLNNIASFVSGRLATIEGVISTSTTFLLKKYKESGRIMDNEEEYEKLKISP